jgi:proteasome lid subunit RPN8/RPN11
MVISKGHWDSLVEHAREEDPNECCGYVRLTDGRIEELFRANNEYQSPQYGYNLDHTSLFAANQLDEEGFEVAVYHSHPRSEARPSQTDINLAQYPHWRYVIISLDGEPTVRAWWIRDGKVEEEDVTVE